MLRIAFREFSARTRGKRYASGTLRDRTHPFPNKPICNHQEIINFMAQSFWQNLFIFKSAIPATAITAAKDFAYDEKKMRSGSVG